MRFSTFAPLPTAKATQLHLKEPHCSQLWRQLCPSWKCYGAFSASDLLQCPQISCEIYIHTHTYTDTCLYMYPSHILSLQRHLGGGRKQLCSGTFFWNKKKSCTVPETHELFNYSQVHYLSYCTNVHILTYTKKQDEGCTQIRLPGQLWIPTVGTPGEARLFHLPGQQELFTAAPQRLE